MFIDIEYRIDRKTEKLKRYRKIKIEIIHWKGLLHSLQE